MAFGLKVQIFQSIPTLVSLNAHAWGDPVRNMSMSTRTHSRINEDTNKRDGLQYILEDETAMTRKLTQLHHHTST